MSESTDTKNKKEAPKTASFTVIGSQPIPYGDRMLRPRTNYELPEGDARVKDLQELNIIRLTR